MGDYRVLSKPCQMIDAHLKLSALFLQQWQYFVLGASTKFQVLWDRPNNVPDLVIKSHPSNVLLLELGRIMNDDRNCLPFLTSTRAVSTCLKMSASVMEIVDSLQSTTRSFKMRYKHELVMQCVASVSTTAIPTRPIITTGTISNEVELVDKSSTVLNHIFVSDVCGVLLHVS
ncbi:hypothetical protein EVAR_22063_1 [Eumeta japonica]|uniref:Uncharacterized protein n=1 Tax=Eumeta variegata TaxID=151549 RepID=A0A4C1USK9_EUMVA|nr:hypothetical protein EVAR_22063_1 [Eumeta japonica]